MSAGSGNRNMHIRAQLQFGRKLSTLFLAVRACARQANSSPLGRGKSVLVSADGGAKARLPAYLADLMTSRASWSS